MRTLSDRLAYPSISYVTLVAGMFLGNIGVWIHRVSQIWLAMSLSATPGKALSYVIIAQTLPSVLLSVVGGVLADKLRKACLMMFFQFIQLLLTLVLAWLVLTNLIASYHIVVAAFLFGAITAIEAPARQTILSELMTGDRVRYAVAINTTIYSASRVVGPAIAGALIAEFGAGLSFLINAITYISIIGAVWFSGALSHQATNHSSPHSDNDAWGFLKKRHDILIILIAFAIMSCFGFNFQMTIGLITKLKFDNSPGLYGALSSLLAVGALVSSLITLKYNSMSATVALCLVTAFGASQFFSGHLTNYYLFASSLVLVGFLGTTAYTLLSTYIQTNSPAHMRGRAISVSNAMNIGSVPLGVVVLGFFSDTYGAEYTFIFGGGIVALSALALSIPHFLLAGK